VGPSAAFDAFASDALDSNAFCCRDPSVVDAFVFIAELLVVDLLSEACAAAPKSNAMATHTQLCIAVRQQLQSKQRFLKKQKDNVMLARCELANTASKLASFLTKSKQIKQ
jgi:hypothetical protein